MNAAGTCAVDWCTWEAADQECNGDHWASPGEGDWPEIEATADGSDNREHVYTAPVWGALDGLAPAVVLWLQRIDHKTNQELSDESFDLTPDEAEALAQQLIRAAQTARATNTEK